MCKYFDCQYYAPKTVSCDFMLISGRPRGCPADDNCEHYCTDPEDMEILRPRFYRPRIVDRDAVRRMEKVYIKNMRTEDLARLANVSVKEALDWTKKVHPDSVVFEYSKARNYGWWN